MTPAQPMFAVDANGLAKLLESRGREFAIYELISNAWDENVTRVTVTLAPVEGRRGRCRLTVEDDSPDGFRDLSHAYTLFAESAKKGNAEQRGRFNLGEKLVLALCDTATISTTTGTVEFRDGQRIARRGRREVGTLFEAVIRMNRADFARTCEHVNRLIPPPGVVTTFNAEVVGHPDVCPRAIDPTLPTLIADAEGVLRPTRRKTVVGIYPTASGESGWIYEMGVPVVETDLPVHANVMQKVPLNTDRDNVTPAYLKELRTHVLNAVARQLDEEQASAAWVNDALAHKDITPEAVDTVLTKRFGEKRVINDPSDPEGTKLAVSKGYTVIPGRSFSREAWENIRATGSTLPAGKVTPSPKPYSDDPNAPVRRAYTGEITPGMQAIIDLTETLGRELMGVKVRVTLINDFGVPASAIYGKFGHHFEYNVARLGKAWFDQDRLSEKVLRLIIHEFGHEYSGDHLSSAYHDALCRLGAKLARLALWNSDALDPEAGGVVAQAGEVS